MQIMKAVIIFNLKILIQLVTKSLLHINNIITVIQNKNQQNIIHFSCKFVGKAIIE